MRLGDLSCPWVSLGITITNQGTQAVRVWIDHGSTAVAFTTTTDGHGSIDGEANAISVDPGATIEVGLTVDSTGAAVGDVLLDGITINAAAEGADAPNGTQNPSMAAVKFLDEGNTDRAGSSVAGAGDVNGDGFDDLLVGAPYSSTTTGLLILDHGTAHLVYGSDSLAATIDLADADVLVRGEDEDDYLGNQVTTMAGVGDIDGDGFDDFVVASRANFPESVYLFHGGSPSGIISVSSADTIFLEDHYHDQAGTSVDGGT